MSDPRCMHCNKRLPVEPYDGKLRAVVTCRYCRKQTVVELPKQSPSAIIAPTN